MCVCAVGKPFLMTIVIIIVAMIIIKQPKLGQVKEGKINSLKRATFFYLSVIRAH